MAEHGGSKGPRLRDLGRRKAFGAVLEEEIGRLGTAEARPFQASGAKPNPLASQSNGLALSGGGIRSAAVALGVVQALEAKKVFHRIDYLSTVSGGGYAGAALVAGLYRNDGKFPFSARSGDSWEAADVADNEAVRAIRDHSRYLMPNGAFDLVVSIGILLRGLVVNAVHIATVIFAIAALVLFLFPDEESLDKSLFLEAIGSISGRLAGELQAWFGATLVATKLCVTLFIIWLVIFAIFRSFVATTAKASPHLQSDPDSGLARATGIAILAIVLLFVIELQRPVISLAVAWFGNAAKSQEFVASAQYVFLTLAAGTAAVGLTFRFFVNLLQNAQNDVSWSALLRAVFARLMLYVSAALLPLLLYGVFIWLVLTGLADNGALPRAPAYLRDEWGIGASFGVLLPIALAATIVILQANLGPIPNSVCSKTWWRSGGYRDRRFTYAVLELVALAALYALFAWWVLPALGEGPQKAVVPWRYATIAAWLGFVSFLFSENGNSLHRLYRDRLEQAFAINRALLPPGSQSRVSGVANPVSEPLRFSDLAQQLRGVARKPYPIVNATINLRASKKNKRARNADYFVFTPDHVGSDATGYVETSEFEVAEPHVDLATAVAISGAAISSSMGRLGTAILAPTLALLNIRLGFWLRNPMYAHCEKARAAAERGDWTLAYFIAEMFGRLSDEMKKVYVTDGGHIDNLGLHELFKRRCDIIIVSDAEADPAMVFPALVDVERFARIDLGVRLDLPVAPLREAALARQARLRANPAVASCSPEHAHAAIGAIHYPQTAGPDPLPAKDGVILYVKSALTGDERNYVLDYERRYPKFPHEPTSDQFFGEEQFEAYRALGFHAMTNALDKDDESERARELRKRLLLNLGLPIPAPQGTAR